MRQRYFKGVDGLRISASDVILLPMLEPLIGGDCEEDKEIC